LSHGAGAILRFDRPSSFLRLLEQPELTGVGRLLDLKTPLRKARLWRHPRS